MIHRVARTAMVALVLAAVAAPPQSTQAGINQPRQEAQQSLQTPIRGRVIDANNAALAGARVRLLSSGGTVLAEVLSDAAGEFVFATAFADAASIEVALRGFRSFTGPARSGERGELRIVLVLTGVSEEVAVTATRSELPLFETPQSTSVVTASSMQEQGVATTPAALEGVTGVYMQRTTFGGGSPIIRGLVGNQVLMMVDGIRLNNSTYRLGPNQYLNTVDSFGAARVEVVRGPASSLYGSDGLGGVVNVLSETVPNRAGFAGGFALGFDSAASAPIGSLRARGREGRVGFVGGITGASFDDLTGGAMTGAQVPTAYDRRAGDLKVAIDLGDAGELRVGGQYFRDDDVPRYDRIESGANEIYLFDPQKRTLGYLRYDTDIEVLGDVNLSATLSRMKQSEGRWLRGTGSTTDRLELDEVTTYGFGLQMTWPEYFRQQLTAGVEYYDDVVASGRTDRDGVTGAQRVRRGRFPDGAGYRSTAAYVQSRVRAAPRLDLLLGARYSRFSADAYLEGFGGDYAATFDDLTGSAYAVFFLAEHWQLSGGVAKGFRAPGLDDATVFGEFNAGIEIPNPDLRPERMINYEATIKALYPEMWLSATVFDAHLSDLIARAPSTYDGSPTYEGEAVFRRQNIDQARIYGTELDIHFWPLDRLEVAGTMAAVHGSDEGGDPLRRIPPVFGRLGGKWRFSRMTAWAGAYLDYATKQDRLASGDISDTRIPAGGTPGYGVVSLNGGLTLSARWQVNAVLYNLGNSDYRVHGSGVNGPGRSLRIFLRADFGS